MSRSHTALSGNCPSPSGSGCGAWFLQSPHSFPTCTLCCRNYALGRFSHFWSLGRCPCRLFQLECPLLPSWADKSTAHLVRLCPSASNHPGETALSLTRSQWMSLTCACPPPLAPKLNKDKKQSSRTNSSSPYPPPSACRRVRRLSSLPGLSSPPQDPGPADTAAAQEPQTLCVSFQNQPTFIQKYGEHTTHSSTVLKWILCLKQRNS